MEKSKRRKSGVELIVFLQSVMLLAFGLCGFVASSTLDLAFNALTNANSSVYMITDDAIISDTNETISTSEAFSVINNFEFVCTSCLAIGFLVFIASSVRLYKNKYHDIRTR